MAGGEIKGLSGRKTGWINVSREKQGDSVAYRLAQEKWQESSLETKMVAGS